MKKLIKNNNVKKILFITLSNIGDVILTIPTLESLYKKYPNAIFDIVGDKRSKIIFKYCPYINKFFEKDKDLGWYGVILLIKSLRQESYDLAVDLRSDALLYFIKSKKKLFKLSNKSSKGMHSVEKHHLSLKRIIEGPPPETNIWLSNYESELTKQIFRKYPNTRILSLGLGANFNGKIWKVSNFIELAKLLKDYFEIIVLVGDQKDAVLSRQFILEYKGIILDCCGHYNLLETTAIIKKSDFYVGNDSGLGHLASAVKTKSFTVFGVGQPNRYKPWGRNAFWIQDKDYEINNIDPKLVAKNIIKQLK